MACGSLNRGTSRRTRSACPGNTPDTSSRHRTQTTTRMGAATPRRPSAQTPAQPPSHRSTSPSTGRRPTSRRTSRTTGPFECKGSTSRNCNATMATSTPSAAPFSPKTPSARTSPSKTIATPAPCRRGRRPVGEHSRCTAAGSDRLTRRRGRRVGGGEALRALRSRIGSRRIIIHPRLRAGMLLNEASRVFGGRVW